MRVTVCQLDVRPDHRDKALRQLGEHARSAASELILLPEMPFSVWLAATDQPDGQRWRASVAEHDAAIARLGDLGVPVVIGTRPRISAGGRRLNQAFVWSADTGVSGVRDKHYLPDEPGFWEATWYDRGELTFPAVEAGGARLGVQICTELWFMEWARHYARLGVGLLCVPRATPHTSVDTWLAGGRAAAVCAGAYCLSSNHWFPGGEPAGGGGLGWIVDPDGGVLGTTSPNNPFCTREVDLDAARAAKASYPRYVVE